MNLPFFFRLMLIVYLAFISGCSSMSPYTRAAASGDLTAIYNYLDGGGGVDQADGSGCTALVHAAHEGHSQIVTTLLAAKADPNILCGGMRSALGKAVRNRDIDMTRALLAAGADVNKGYIGSLSIISMESYYRARESKDPYFGRNKGNVIGKGTEILDLLLASGANITTGHYNYPIHSVIAWDYDNLVLKVLLRAGADANRRDHRSSNDTPMDALVSFYNSMKDSTYAGKPLGRSKASFEEAVKLLARHGGKATKVYSDNSSNFAQIFATTAVIAGAASANIPTENAIDIASATVKDIWNVGGKSNRTVEKQISIANGNYQITDPQLRASAESRIEVERWLLKRQLLERQQHETQQELAKAKDREEELQASPESSILLERQLLKRLLLERQQHETQQELAKAKGREKQLQAQSSAVIQQNQELQVNTGNSFTTKPYGKPQQETVEGSTLNEYQTTISGNTGICYQDSRAKQAAQKDGVYKLSQKFGDRGLYLDRKNIEYGKVDCTPCKSPGYSRCKAVVKGWPVNKFNG